MTKNRERQIKLIVDFLKNDNHYNKAVVYENTADIDNRDLEIAVFVSNPDDYNNYELIFDLQQYIDRITDNKNCLIIGNHPGIPEYLKEDLQAGVVIYGPK